MAWRDRPPAEPPRPQGFDLGFAFATLALAFLAFTSMARIIPLWVGIVYGVFSLLAGLAYAWDKSRAQRHVWRITESTLQFLALLGGWPGALLAQRLCRHKVRKVKFQVVFWLIVTGHLALWGWLATAGRPLLEQLCALTFPAHIVVP